MRATVAGPIVAALVLAFVLSALPVRREVSGWSMAPGLLPGERVTSQWFPAIDRLRKPRRHERWIVAAPDGTEVIKRVVGCGGEAVRLVDGDLELNGRIEPPPPVHLVDRATVVESAGRPPWGYDKKPGHDDGRRLLWRSDRLSVLDDARFAPTERRLLLPVRDVGVCVRVRVDRAVMETGEARVTVGIDGRAAAWSPSASGPFVLLVGRVDRHLVGAAWRQTNERGHPPTHPGRLPRDPPARWSLAAPWIGPNESPFSTLTVSSEGSAITVEEILVWRDVLYRPAADGRSGWRIGAGEVFLLGDFPSGSIDSRQVGPFPNRALLVRIAPGPPAW